jgi:D-alanyl-D-alanine dipeptidase
MFASVKQFIPLLFVIMLGCQTAPPKEKGPFRTADLVELAKLDPTLHLEIRYASTNNFLHKPVYRQARAFLQRPAAEALLRANARLKPLGWGLLVFDGYRPWSVTKTFWDSVGEHERKIGFVANPQLGSKHNRGCAVDLTLYDLKTGRAAVMPSEYDEFSERAYANFAGGPEDARKRRDLLRDAMVAEGFEVFPEEWWHFNYSAWQHYPILNIPFEAIP